MNTFQVLLDAPGEPAKRIQIARLGPVKDPRYGEFDITADNAANWATNLSQLPGGRALIDFEHRSEKAPRNSEAAGWITGISLDGSKVMGDVEWTDKGEDAIRNKRYLFLSPAYGKYSNEHGQTFDDTLCSLGLTNKPVLGSLPMLTLASEERVSEALQDDPAARFYTRALDGELGEQARALVMLDVSQAERDKAKGAGNSLSDGSYPINNAKQLHSAAILAASGHGDVAAAKKLIRRRAKELGVDVTTLPGFGKNSPDSPRSMDSAALLTTLGIEPNDELVTALDAVDETQGKILLDAVAALQTKAETVPEVKTLDQLAATEGKIVLDQDAVKQLQTAAAAGTQAMKLLSEQRFEHAFETALSNPEGAKVTPGEKDSLKHFYTLDADATLKMIEDREPLVSGQPKGKHVLELSQETDPTVLMQNGVHPEDHNLDAQIQKYMRENKLPASAYPKVLEQVTTGQVTL